MTCLAYRAEDSNQFREAAERVPGVMSDSVRDEQVCDLVSDGQRDIGTQYPIRAEGRGQDVRERTVLGDGIP